VKIRIIRGKIMAQWSKISLLIYNQYKRLAWKKRGKKRGKGDKAEN